MRVSRLAIVLFCFAMAFMFFSLASAENLTKVYDSSTQKITIANAPVQDINVSSNKTHMFFRTDYLNISMEHIDFFVPKELQDDLAYLTPCDTNAGFFCQGNYTDAIYGQDKLFHIKTDPNSGSSRFYLLTDYMFTYAQYDPDGDIPKGFNWKRINQEISMNYRASNQNGAVFDGWNKSSDINISVSTKGYDLIIKWDYYNATGLAASFNRTFKGSIAEYRLLSNGCDKSFRFCNATLEVDLSKENKLLDKIDFYQLIGSEIFIGKVRWHKEYIYTLGEKINISDYGFVCDGANSSCEYKQIGSHLENAPEWTEYNGEIYAGKRILLIKAEKRPSWIIDWMPTLIGIFCPELAIWGNISLGDTAEVNLISPANNSYVQSFNTNFISTFNITNGATLTNVSTCTNISGSWACSNFTDLRSMESANFVSYFKLDSDIGDYFNTHNGSLIAGNYVNDSAVNKSIFFNGVNQYATIGTNTYFEAGNFTLSLWIKTNASTGTNQIPFFKKDGAGRLLWGFDMNSTGNGILTGVSSGTTQYLTSYNSISIGQWHNIVSTFNGSYVSLYIDGAIKEVKAGSSSPLTLDNPTTIGARNDLYYDYNGSIDEIGIWNKSLNSTQITQLYNSGNAQRFLPVSFYSLSSNLTINGTTLNNAFGCDSDGVCGFAQNNFTVSPDFPNITIFSPDSTITSSSVLINFSANATYGIENCSYNITRGASTEKTNTYITNFSGIYFNDSALLSGEATYSLNIYCNNTGGIGIITNKTFVYSAIVTPGQASSGGGGGGSIIASLTEVVANQVCSSLLPSTETSWSNFRKEMSWQNFKTFWFAFMNYALCENSASLIPVIRFENRTIEN